MTERPCERSDTGKCTYPHRTFCRECPVFLGSDPQKPTTIRLDRIELVLKEILEELKKPRET